MTVVLQVSDPHFGTEQPQAVVALQRLSAELRPDLLLVTGDITQRARADQFARAKAFFDQLGVPARLVIPGNHDIPLFDVYARAFHPYGRYARAFGTVLEGRFERDDLLVITVNTTRRYRHKHGEVSAEQVERVAQQLAAARPGQLRIVAVHQPVAVPTTDTNNLLRGHEAAVRRWSAAGADIIMGGHIHLPYVVPLRSRWPGLPREVWAVQAGTALSSRVRGGIPNSVNVIRTGPGRSAVVERWDVDATAGVFRRISETPVRPDP
jgi:3',5'-cyclic AMP phosphodiesterase CpdA